MNKREILTLPDEIKKRQPIVFFDGECNLCSHSVQFLIKKNKKGNLSFASLQSASGEFILANEGIKAQNSDTLLLLQNNLLYCKSSAALKVTSHLTFPWYLLGVFKVVPAFARDAIYSFIAKNRYRWFGKKLYCITGESILTQRFLS